MLCIQNWSFGARAPKSVSLKNIQSNEHSSTKISVFWCSCIKKIKLVGTRAPKYQLTDAQTPSIKKIGDDTLKMKYIQNLKFLNPDSFFFAWAPKRYTLIFHSHETVI